MSKGKIRETITPIHEPITSGSIDTILASLYRTILSDLGISDGRLTNMIDRFILDDRSGIPKRKRSSTKGNLSRELRKTSMTWRIFCRGIKLLNVKSFRVTVDLVFRNSLHICTESKKIPMDEMPSDDEAVSTNTDKILADVYRELLDILDVDHIEFNRLMDMFLSDARNAIPQNIRKRSSVRGNLRRELLKPTMTWKVFCRGLKFLNAQSFVFIIELWHYNGRITLHKSLKILLDDIPTDISSLLMETQ